MPDMSKYDDVLSDIAAGVTVKNACEIHGVNRSTFLQHVDKDLYARAREACADAIAEDIMRIADDGSNDWMEANANDDPGWRANGEHIQRSKLRVDARKWLLSKIAPKQYGDRIAQEISGPDGGPISIESVLSAGRKRALQRSEPDE